MLYVFEWEVELWFGSSNFYQKSASSKGESTFPFTSKNRGKKSLYSNEIIESLGDILSGIINSNQYFPI